MPKIEYYDTGKKSVRKKIWYSDHYKTQRSKVEIYYENGNMKYEFYLKDGQFHNLYGPAIIWFHEDGSFKYQDWHINGDKIDPPYDNYPLTKDQKVELKLIHG